MRFQTVQPFGQSDLSIVVLIAVLGELLAALPQLLDWRDHFTERLPFAPLPHLVLVLVQDHKTQCADSFVIGSPTVCVVQAERLFSVIII